MIKGVRQLVDTDKLVESAENFCNTNQLPEQLSKEIVYVCKAFAGFFNTCKQSDTKFDLDTVLNLFESNLSVQAEALGIGLQTNAVVFYRVVPYIADLLKKLEAESKVQKDSEYEARLKAREEGLARAEKRIKNLEEQTKEELEEAKRRSRYSSRSYGGC